MRRSGFTLLELLAVVVILGILAAAALPNFSKGSERAKVRDAQAVLAAIHSAEQVYYLDQNAYGTGANLYDNNYLVDPDAGNSNPDWEFDVAGGAGFTATATRTGGSYNGNTIEITEAFDGNCYNGNHPLRDAC